MKILMVYPEFPDTFWSFKHALRFVQKKASFPPLGLITIASLLPDYWETKLVDLNVRNLRNIDIEWADMVFISAMVVQRASTQEVIDRCNNAGKTIVAGGPLFTSEWGKFPTVDHFILNEGELTLPPFIKDLVAGKTKRVYSSDDYAEMTLSPIPKWSLVSLSNYDSLSIQYSRGCPFNCDFCNITALLGHKPRTKNAGQIIAELDEMYSLGWRRNIFFVDDNFICNKRQVKEEILPALIEWRKSKIGCNFITEASINLSDDPELMRLMTEAGFVSVFVGIETPNEESLAECKKSQNTRRDLVESVHNLQKNGLQVMGGFIVGFDNDNLSIFEKQIEFIQQSGIVTAMVGMLQAPFGTGLYSRMEKEGRLIKEMSGDNADGTTNIIPKMGIANLSDGYRRVIHEIYCTDKFYQRVKTFLKVYNPPKLPVHVEWEEILAFFRSIWYLGILSNDRGQYWRLFLWTLFKYPRKFALAITFTIYGFHFRKVSSIQGL